MPKLDTSRFFILDYWSLFSITDVSNLEFSNDTNVGHALRITKLMQDKKNRSIQRRHTILYNTPDIAIYKFKLHLSLVNDDKLGMCLFTLHDSSTSTKHARVLKMNISVHVLTLLPFCFRRRITLSTRVQIKPMRPLGHVYWQVTRPLLHWCTNSGRRETRVYDKMFQTTWFHGESFLTLAKVSVAGK